MPKLVVVLHFNADGPRGSTVGIGFLWCGQPGSDSEILFVQQENELSWWVSLSNMNASAIAQLNASDTKYYWTALG